MRQVNLTVPKPCTQSWADMIPTDEGRYCGTCRKNVVDFTKMTDAELFAYFVREDAFGLCGRFRGDQLQSPLTFSSPDTPRSWWKWVSLVVFWGLQTSKAEKASAQTRVEQTVENKQESIPSTEPKGALLSAIQICGTVLDSATHEGLPGVSVLLKGTKHGRATDLSGSFNLDITPEQWAASNGSLRFSYIAYFAQEVPLSGLSSNLGEVILKVDKVAMREASLIVTGACGPYYAKPWPWHPRSFYHWSKYKIKQLFSAN